MDKVMNRVLLALGVLALVGCGGDSGGGGDISLGDASVSADAPPGGGACNPIANTGCPTGQKCTFVVESTDPVLGRTTCAPDGDKPSGSACTRDDVSGSDDCEGGSYCQNGLCNDICSVAPDSCGVDATCVHVNNIFDDDNVGFCNPPCDVFAQDCLNDEACYILITRPGAPTVCAPARTEPGGAAPGLQGEACSFINTCTKGYGCLLNNAPMDATGLECAFLCDAAMSGGPTCATEGPGPQFVCRQINMFYGDVPDVPDEIGFCVDPTEFPEMM
jgi:hypothetical protein